MNIFVLEVAPEGKNLNWYSVLMMETRQQLMNQIAKVSMTVVS